MHSRTTSGDSALMIRRNPLNIRAGDGSDFVVGPSQSKPATEGLKPNDNLRPCPIEDVTDLGINEELEKPEAPTRLVSADWKKRMSLLPDLDNNDLGEDLAHELAGFSLTRSNTIAARSVAKASAPGQCRKASDVASTGPSQDPALVQRLRSLRARMSKEGTLTIPDTNDDMEPVGLPESVLEMIAFSPESPWLASEIDAFEDEAANEVTPNVMGLNSPFTSPSEAGSLGGFSKSVSPVLVQKAPTSPQPVLATEVTEEEETKAPAEVDDDPVSEDDRGRLFLQINKLANLRGLPIDVSRHPRFTLTLDNGLQTVTTAPMSLPPPNMGGQIQVRIGQEFELMVGKDLELVITVNVAMDALQPPERPQFQAHNYSNPASPKLSPPPSPKKGMRHLLSPKKTKQKEREQQVRLEAQERFLERERRHDAEMASYRKRADIWRGVTGSSGQYCRGYLFESHYEREIWGSARTYALPLHTEWSSDCKNGEAPKHVCDIQVTMMYVPKLHGSEQLPVSMRECQRAVIEAKAERGHRIEGFLTQCGGDCTLWRRRWFTLKNNELVGHHEQSRQRRILINMEDAIKVEDRLSEDVWCIYEDRSFQITFKDGECISFYADNQAQRDAWLTALNTSLVHSTGQKRCWTDLVLDREL